MARTDIGEGVPVRWQFDNLPATWQSIFTIPTRRRQTVIIILSSLVPFFLCFIWLLSVLDWAPVVDQGDPTLSGQTGTAQTFQKFTVKASTGSYVGKVNEKYENVHEFLNVPYGVPPTGKNRFMPPVPVAKSDETFDATRIALACPQFASRARTVWSEQIPWYRIPQAADVPRRGETSQYSSEECLSLAIWKPTDAAEGSYLPVAMFWPGGGFTKNGVLVPAHQAAQWVNRSQSHIVVTINYRLSILGFPGAAGVEDQNLGLLDQRLALEWVRDNIKYFGGDSSRIMLWGFSAGAQSVDFHNYAYWEDPIAHAHFAQSGSCLAFGSGQSEDHSKFTYVAKRVGCDHPNNPSKELECMQGVDYKDIINFIGQHEGEPRLRFGPVADGRTVFTNYRDRYAAGNVTKAPMIYSSCANDGSTLASYDPDHPSFGPTQGTVNGITQRIMCGASESAHLRHDNGLITYRYQYAGIWPNQNPLRWMGAYHSSDLVMMFGTYENGAGPLATALERETSEVMQDYLLAFMKDPHNGPPAIGWPQFDPKAANGGTILRFGADRRAVQDAAAGGVEGVCSHPGASYDPFP